MKPHATTPPLPTRIELVAKLILCAAVLELRAQNCAGEYKPYFADRAQQCRKWVGDLKEGHRTDLEHIAGGLAEFEAMAL